MSLLVVGAALGFALSPVRLGVSQSCRIDESECVGATAEPNAPLVAVVFEGNAANLSFLLNPWQRKADFREEATVRFSNCSRWNWDATNDHAWFAGEGRYAKQAPKWGEFYEVVGEDILGGNIDWEIIAADTVNARHFLFYFRDETLEFIASDWSMSIKTIP